MDFGFDKDQEAFRKELREFFKAEMAPQHTEGQRDQREMAGWTSDFERRMRRRTGEAGYLGIAWPKEYGGQGRDMIYQAILGYEAAYSGAPAIDIGVSIVAAPLMLFGTDEQKSLYLPKILRGEVNFCLGYSEPGAGSDLANLATKAELDGDEFAVTGRRSSPREPMTPTTAGWRPARTTTPPSTRASA